jgi:hypothetical protein
MQLNIKDKVGIYFHKCSQFFIFILKISIQEIILNLFFTYNKFFFFEKYNKHS